MLGILECVQNAHFCCQCCGLSQKILKLLNDRNDNY